MAAFVGAGVTLVLDLDNRLALSAILVCTGLIVLASEFLIKPKPVLARALLTAPLAVVAVLVEPQVFVVVGLVLGMNLHWVVMKANHRWLEAIAVAVISATCLAAAVVDAPQWELVTMTLAIIVPTHLLVGFRVRDRHEQTNANMAEVLRNAGIIVYEKTPATGYRNAVYKTLSGPLFDLTGWTRSEWARKGKSLVHPDDVDAYWADPSDFSDDTLLDRTARFEKADGGYVWLRDVSRMVFNRDGTVRQLGLLADVSSSQLELIKMRRRAHIDALTGVPNRFALLDVLADRLADNRDGGSRFALLIIDLNKFKDINDSLGHDYGDEALRRIAERLHATMRPGDEIGRLGGDEFAVVATDVASFEQASAVAERISAGCNEPLDVHDLSVTASISVGVALSEPGIDAEALLRRADAAMYAAKRSGKSHQVFSPRIGNDAGNDLVLSAQVPAALSNGEFELHFQPKFDFAAERFCGVEGLARWRHPELGLLLPSDFVHLVEVSDSARFFTDRMLDAGIAFAGELAAAELDMTVAVNVSILTLYDDNFPLRMRAMLERHRVPPSSIILEITEQDIMEESRGAPPVLTRLHEIGVRVAIDDFGTGYSSLARLQDLPVSEIKIDRRFVTNAHVNNSDRVIVRSIIDLAANLGMQVVAEGVETADEAEMLRGLGCDQGQGYLYGHAKPGVEMLVDLTEPEVHLFAVRSPTDDQQADEAG